ncbi:MAG: diaminopropionate ammonia-lyase [Gammaproteobacteria bacterium]
MTLSPFAAVHIQHCHNARAQIGGRWPLELNEVLPGEQIEQALAEIASWPGYSPTPLHELTPLAHELGIAQVFYKDESFRFGLESFKALGGAYAVARLLEQQISARTGQRVTARSIRSGQHAAAAREITVATATDGNHGRSVAWGAQTFGCPCKIYIHAEVSEGRKRAMETFGAEIVRIKGNYDASVRQAAADAEDNGWFIVSDTSYEGYTDLPRLVMAGYAVMVDEILDVTGADAPFTHVFVQGGVGGLAAALCARLWQRLGESRPRFVIVEPDRAPCLYRSAVNGEPTAVTVTEETIMAGLSCGEVSELAWKILYPGANDFLTLPDDAIGPTMRGLGACEYGSIPVVGGESGVAGLAALIAITTQGTMTAPLELSGDSRVLVLGTEGATDPEIYTRLTGMAPSSIRGSHQS